MSDYTITEPRPVPAREADLSEDLCEAQANMEQLQATADKRLDLVKSLKRELVGAREAWAAQLKLAEATAKRALSSGNVCSGDGHEVQRGAVVMPLVKVSELPAGEAVGSEGEVHLYCRHVEGALRALGLAVVFLQGHRDMARQEMHSAQREGSPDVDALKHDLDLMAVHAKKAVAVEERMGDLLRCMRRDVPTFQS